MASHRAQEAYRARAGIVGALLSCACLYPLERATTSTEHSIQCPAHWMLCTPAERASLPPPFEWRAEGGGMRGRCSTCGAEVTATSMQALSAEMAANHRHPMEAA